MACVVEPEVQFAQRLASNEKPLRRKALKKLRSYIRARSRTQTGFSEEDLLKLWKGLFYCLWMQDKPVLQEELSTQISGLVHHFHSFGAQLLYLQTFLTTVMREWTGIDCLRMDKFFQLVRFMFRQMFDVLQRSQWEPSSISLFLELLSSVLLQTGAPSAGLQLHVLDLYLKELAVVGAEELRADQNLVFIEPFCKAAAKTKDRALFSAICNSIFSTIIDQAPFAIQDLMEELQQDSDSDNQEKPESKLKSKKIHGNKMKSAKRSNGLKAHSEEEAEDDEDDDDQDQSVSEKPFDEDVGPVLQFDYRALADKLLELSSRHNTPSRNRKRLYKIIRLLRDLSDGVFPQDEYPEEVSTDEDDDDFGSRKRMKRRPMDDDSEEQDSEERVKGKKNKSPTTTSEENGVTSCEKAKKRKKKKKPQSQTEAADTADGESTTQLQPPVHPQDQPQAAAPSLLNGHTETAPKAAKRKRKRTIKTKRTEEALEPQSAHSEPELHLQSQELSETHVDQSTAAEPTEAEDTAPLKTTTKKKKKKCPVGPDNPDCEHQKAAKESQPKDEIPPEQNTEKPGSETPGTRVKTAKKRKASGQRESTSQPEEHTDAEKKKKKRRKIPVEFEYEADEVQAEQSSADTPAADPQPPLSSKPQKIQKQQPAQTDFVSFQSSSPPAPLFCRARAPHTPPSTNTKPATRKADSKKVRFGLKNNQTAEFHKTDRSLLLSPEGPSRVPFDPEQRPKCGVLKSPPTPFPKRKKARKTKVQSVKARPTAADFF